MLANCENLQDCFRLRLPEPKNDLYQAKNMRQTSDDPATAAYRSGDAAAALQLAIKG
jgi:hypothetical protein